MKRFVRPGAFLLLAALLFCLSGCYSGNIDQYFSLPMASEEYRQLQSLIDEELASGSEYSAPIHGSYRQSVQLSDVDGDGEVTPMDAVLAYAIANGEQEATAEQLTAADVDGDGEITPLDAVLIYAFCNGELSKFPVQG